jgi:hypothetical protein
MTVFVISILNSGRVLVAGRWLVERRRDPVGG